MNRTTRDRKRQRRLRYPGPMNGLKRSTALLLCLLLVGVAAAQESEPEEPQTAAPQEGESEGPTTYKEQYEEYQKQAKKAK